jgi:CDGSH-type Zn-finger protein
MGLKIKAREDGPYLVPGKASYVVGEDEEGETTGKVVALCRCGGSSNKPLCDGTHRKINFQAEPVELDLE